MLIFEDVNGGTLRSHLHENSHFSLDEMIKFSLKLQMLLDIYMLKRWKSWIGYGLSNRLKRQAVKYKYLGFYKNLILSANEPNSRPEIQIIVANLKSLIINCDQNTNRHGLEFTHLQNSFIIPDSMMYNSISLQESPMHIDKTFIIEPNHTLKSPADLNKRLEIEPNNANFLTNCGITLDQHYSIDTSAQNNEPFSIYKDNTNAHINSFEITTLSPLYLPNTINSTIQRKIITINAD
ncbi:hypothetical protein F8M41_016730 [Gigaspora margarita]|uniref:Uncharacterized protein n=1 Tax=Gigaspora margarita TaxID=4874 RepID=A0A8H4ANW9_GIGMA|nr:hypothetical protein F8M41_016730 [Gigaspora margarita]